MVRLLQRDRHRAFVPIRVHAVVLSSCTGSQVSQASAPQEQIQLKQGDRVRIEDKSGEWCRSRCNYNRQTEP